MQHLLSPQAYPTTDGRWRSGQGQAGNGRRREGAVTPRGKDKRQQRRARSGREDSGEGAERRRKGRKKGFAEERGTVEHFGEGEGEGG